MGTALTIVTNPEMATRRPRTAAVRPALCHQWDFVPPQDGLPVAHAAAGLWQVEHDLHLFYPPAACRGWARLLAALRRLERQRQGRQPEPSAGSVDSQSIKTATQGAAVGFDGNKKIKGRKRHLLVDTLGLILAVVVTSANADDRHPIAVPRAPIGSGPDYQADALRATILRFLIEEGYAESLIEAALHFAWSTRCLSTALVGFSSLDQLEQAVTYAERGGPPAEALRRLTQVRESSGTACHGVEKGRVTTPWKGRGVTTMSLRWSLSAKLDYRDIV